MENNTKNGWIEVIAGCMFCGKTEELIRRVRRTKIADQTVLVFKHASDTRYDEREVTSHNGLQVEAIPVYSSSALGAMVEKHYGVEVVAIDEAQFFDASLPLVCDALADAGIRVIVAGLDMDFRGNPFGPVPVLLACAKEVLKLDAICVKCKQRKATRTQRIINGNPAAYGDPQIVVGANETYEARCRGCHEVPR